MRTPVTVKIKFKSASLEQFIERYSVDVSQGGIFVRTPKPLSVGTSINFEFQLQDGSPLLSGSGTVVWIREQDAAKGGGSPGMGVRFDQLPPPSQKVLTQVLEQKQRAQEFSDQPTRVAPDAKEMVEQAAAGISGGAESQPEPVGLPDFGGMDAGAVPPEDAVPTVVAPQDEEPPPMPPPSMEVPMELASRATNTEVAPEPAQGARTEEEPAPRAAASSPAVEEREEPESEAVRKERLAKILFSETEESTEEESSEGAEPLAEPAPVRAPRVTEERRPVRGEKKSSGAIVWVLVLLAAGGGFFLWWTYGRKGEPKQPAGGSAVGAAGEPGGAASKPAEPPKAPASANLKVSSTPAGAKILLDGTDTGKVTPAELTGFAKGKDVAIALDLPGKKLVTVTGKAGGPEVSANLEKASVRTVELASEPAGATVTLDGKKVGKTPTTYAKALDLSKGKHAVVFKLSGHADQTVELGPDSKWERKGEDEVLKVSATLEKKGGGAAAPAAAPKKKRSKAKAADEGEEEGEAKAAPAKKDDAKDEAKDDEPKDKKPAIKSPAWGN